MLPKLRLWPALWMTICGLGIQTSVQCASFNVNPVGFYLSAERSAGVLQIRNTGDAAVRLQVQALDWRTDGRIETLTQTDALVLNPPIFAIEPGQVQFVRFGLRRAEPSPTEQSYRLMIDEVPASRPRAVGLNTVLRVSIPVFIRPASEERKLTWQLRVDATGIALTALNEGNVHSKILGVQLGMPDGVSEILLNSPMYLLPGQRKVWPLANRMIRAAAVRVHIQTDKGESEEILTLEGGGASGD